MKNLGIKHKLFVLKLNPLFVLKLNTGSLCLKNNFLSGLLNLGFVFNFKSVEVQLVPASMRTVYFIFARNFVPGMLKRR
jgi:hypothetical protein